jgi:DNA-binding MarR family transcriptional regulator/N-acetylglutamate synthase-like GNAT family acetyltransferase
MAEDGLAELGFLFLGSRMKRLAERMQADATKIFEAAGHGRLLPAFNVVLATLDRQGEATIGELGDLIGVSQPAITRTVSAMVEAGIVTNEAHEDDQRIKVVRQTDAGRRMAAHLKATAWRQIAEAARDLSVDAGNADILERLAAYEAKLAQKPLMQRTGEKSGLSIVEFSDELATSFYDLNADWIRTMFAMEKADEEVLSNPRKHIISKGGAILFVRDAEGEIIGTGALQPVGKDGDFEFTKMAVKARRRGEKAGEFLLVALIERARRMGVKKLHLLTNTKCEAAIHLYEKMGFAHSEQVMKKFAAKYERANVAMRYPI